MLLANLHSQPPRYLSSNSPQVMGSVLQARQPSELEDEQASNEWMDRIHQ